MLAAAIFHAYAPITVPIVTATTATGEREFEIPRFFQERKGSVENPLYGPILVTRRVIYFSERENERKKRKVREKGT